MFAAGYAYHAGQESVVQTTIQTTDTQQAQEEEMLVVEPATNTEKRSEVSEIASLADEQDSQTNTPATIEPEASTIIEAIPEEITVDTSTLGESEQRLLQMIGVDSDEVTITREMIECAEEKIGAERLTEIVAGQAPSFQEGLSLFNCYQN